MAQYSNNGNNYSSSSSNGILRGAIELGFFLIIIGLIRPVRLGSQASFHVKNKNTTA